MNNVPNPKNVAAAIDNMSSIESCLLNFVEVTSYTKNQAMKKVPMLIKSSVSCEYIPGLIGDV